MVAKIVSGKSIRGILNYNENKVAAAEAQLLIACGFPRGHEELSFKNKLERFEMLTGQNEKTHTNALHISLNFSRREEPDDDLMRRIAMDYMDKIGFGNQPYLVYRHYDAAHPHLHIATVNIADGGSRIETHNIGKNQSEKARKEIETWYGLVRAEDQQKETAYLLKAAQPEKLIYGKAETKAAISSIVRDVVASYKFTSLPEMNAVLRQFNVMADRGEQGSKMFEKGGLVYYITDSEGRQMGIPVKASSIYSSPTLKNLEKRFATNDASRKPYAVRIKHLLDKTLSTARDREQIETSLQQQGIRVLLRQSATDDIYGVTFIDNGTRCVFNGSDLGKAYSAKAFMERLQKTGFELSGEEQSSDRQAIAQSGAAGKYPAQQQAVFEVLRNTSSPESYKPSGPDPSRKKKKGLQTE